MAEEVLSSAKSEADVSIFVSLESTAMAGYIIDAPISYIADLIRQIKYSWKTLDHFRPKQFYSYTTEKVLSQQYQWLAFHPANLSFCVAADNIAYHQLLHYCSHPDIDYDLILEILNKLNNRSDEDYHEIVLLCSHSLLAQLATYALDLKYFISVLKRCTAEALRFLFLAHQTRNRVSRNPTPQKKEPPVGGVKIGGKQHDYSRHVAEILYLKQTFTFKQAA